MFVSTRCVAASAAVVRRVRAARLHTSSLLFKDLLVSVPKMGDSITEGTLIKLTKQPGDAVAVDEVVAVIETDKVSVDVRTPEAGVLKQIHAGLQSTVAVGAPLVTIDSGATGGASSKPAAAPAASAPAPVPAPAAPAPAPVPAAAASSSPSSSSSSATASSSSSSHHRKPSIHFRHGQRAAIDQQMGAHASSSGGGAANGGSAAATGDYLAALDAAFPSKATRDALSLPPMYGRPLMSTAEMYAIESGGAYTAVEAPPAGKDKKAKK